MKTSKFILIAATLICASAVSTMSAQQAAPAQEHQWKVAIGDSVMIKPECQKYLTGETPSTWVYDKVHTVRQLGSKRFPEGVLLMNIYSWMCEECLVPVGAKAVEQEQAKKAQEEQVKTQEAEKIAAEKAAAERLAARKIVAEKKVAEAIAAHEAAQVAAEKAAAARAAADEAAKNARPRDKKAQAEVARLQAEAAAAEQAAQEAAAKAEAAKKEAQIAVRDAGGDKEWMHEQLTKLNEGTAAPAETPVEEEPATELAAIGDTLTSRTIQWKGYDRFTIGVRGGAAGLLHQVKAGNWTCGGDAMLDLQYAHYWTKEGVPADLGLIVGLGIGYSQSGMKASVDTSYTVTTTDGNIDYTLKADEVNEKDGQIQLEVPIMFSMIHQKGVFFNFGPKFMIPVYTPYNQKITNPQINAYFPAEGIKVSNEVITGYLKDNQMTNGGSDNGNQFSINIMLSAELGYEWILKNGNSLGLGAYANYCVYNSFKNSASVKSLMDVTAPQGSTVASVNVLSATKTYATGLGYFDAGIKLAYHFNFPKKQYVQFKESQLF